MAGTYLLGLGSSYSNFPIFTIPLAIFMTYSPHFIRGFITLHASGKWTNFQPRHQNNAQTSTLPPKAAERVKCCQGAHNNGLETLPIYIGAILAASYSNVEHDLVSRYAAFYVVSRLAY